MTDGCNKEGYQIVKSDGIYFKDTDCEGSEETKGEPYSGRRTVSNGYTILLTRPGVHGVQEKEKPLCKGCRGSGVLRKSQIFLEQEVKEKPLVKFLFKD